MLTDNSFERLSDPIVDVAEGLTFRMLRLLRSLLEGKVDDPDSVINIRSETNKVAEQWQSFDEEAREWTDTALPDAYLRGIQKTNGEVPDTMTADNPISQAPLMASGGGGGNISDEAARILDKYPKHHTMYSVFQEQTYQSFRQTRVPVIRDIQGKIREVITETSDITYRTADEFTRRQLSQDLMNRFAKENIAGIRYADGRTMKIDTYSELTARTQTGNASREAAFRRQEEYGLSLTQISVHYPCSNLCEPYQGRVFSINGTSDQYPPLQDAISGGLYHANCKHFQSAYIPGTSKLPKKEYTRTKNKKMYKAQQRQRQIERNIRKYKRMEASALTEKDRKRAKSFIRKWQGKQRNLIDNNSFLRRKYFRESIN